MSNDDIDNGYMNDEFGIPMPSPQQAWQDMLTRLDDDMPTSAVPLPGSIIQVDNGLMRGITSLLGLLFITAASLLFVGKDKNDSSLASANKHRQALGLGNGGSSDIGKAPLHLVQDTVTNANNSIAPGADAAHNKTLGNTYAKPAKGSKLSVNRKPGAIQNNSKDYASNGGTAQGLALAPLAPPSATKGDSTAAAVAKTNTTTQTHGKTKNDASDSTKKEETGSDSAIWQAGIWVKAQLPFSGAQHYFAGPNGASQPWRTLLPGVWVSVQLGKKLFEAEIHPFAQTVYNPKPFEENTITVNNRLATETKRLNKTFGVSLSAGYSYNISGNWWLGGRVQGSLLTKAVGTIEVSNDSAIISKRFTAFKKDSANLQPLQVRLDAEALYKANRWAAGIRAGVYFSPAPIKQSSTIKNPFETEVFFRWRLWGKKK